MFIDAPAASFLKKHHGPNIERGQRRKVSQLLRGAKRHKKAARFTQPKGYARGARVTT